MDFFETIKSFFNNKKEDLVIEAPFEQEAPFKVDSIECERWTNKILEPQQEFNAEKATSMIINFYQLFGYSPPKEIVFCASPLESIMKYLLLKYLFHPEIVIFKSDIWTPLISSLEDRLFNLNNELLFDPRNALLPEDCLITSFLNNKEEAFSLMKKYNYHFDNNLIDISFERLTKQSISSYLEDNNFKLTRIEDIFIIPAYVYYITVCYDYLKHLKGNDIEARGSERCALKDFVEYCGWIIPCKELCIVSERPQILKTKEIEQFFEFEYMPHSDDALAIKYSDGFSIWAYEGVLLTDKRYHTHPNNWKPEWLLDEKNAEIRRVLMQALGTDRILSKLKATKLDSWREYELYKLADSIDLEDFVVVKMTDPSTGFIHCHRVPPEITSARVAITWVNHGLDPESFEKET